MQNLSASSEMDLLTSAAAGMSAQRTVLDLAARNVAAAQASTPDHPYSRLVAQFSSAPDNASLDDPFETEADDDRAAAPAIAGVHSEPGSGDALAEMIAVLDAQRAYEQNASIFDIGKRLAERTIDIGRS
jgi:flagellar basal body rod protein FlgC